MIPRYQPSLDTATTYRALLGRVDASVPGDSPMIDRQGLIFQPSASHALLHTLLALKLSGRVVVPAYTCERVVAAVIAAGCRPHFVDINPDSGTISVDGFRRALAERPVAVVATHLFGIPCDIPNIAEIAREHDILVIEDCALSSGTIVEGRATGEWGDIAVFSFGTGKTLNFGYGGAIKINKPELSSGIETFLQTLRSHSTSVREIRALTQLLVGSGFVWRSRYGLIEAAKTLLGRGSRAAGRPALSTLTAAPLSDLQQKILFRLVLAVDQNRFYVHRRLLGDIYTRSIKANSLLRPLVNPNLHYEAVYPSFPLRVAARTSLHARLRKAGFDSSLFFSYNAAEMCGNSQCPNSGELSKTILCLPVHTGVSAEDAHSIADIVNSWSSQTSRH